MDIIDFIIFYELILYTYTPEKSFAKFFSLSNLYDTQRYSVLRYSRYST